ncbi:MAG TPA: response regulator [Verrucomicrobiae bacterium]
MKNDRILIIDDNPSIHEDIRKILAGAVGQNETFAASKSLLFEDEVPAAGQGVGFEIDSAYQGQEGLVKVEQATESGRPYALAFVDVRMPPGWDGIETISRIWEKCPDLQAVICTAYSDYSWPEMIRQIGKSDNLVILKKPFDNIEVMQLAHALTEKWLLNHQVKRRLEDLDHAVTQRATELQISNEKLRKEIAERTQAENALRLSEERFSKAFKSSPIPLAIQSLRRDVFVDTNEGFLRLTGFDRSQLVSHSVPTLNLWADPADMKDFLQELHRQRSVRNLPRRLRTRSGSLRHVLLSAELLDLDSEPLVLIIAQDITEQLALENQLRQAQKMEAVGQLAAGVAHDFNNILTVIQGYSSLMLTNNDLRPDLRKPLETIFAATERACKLVRQLLTFSRKQSARLKPMNVETVLVALSELLPRLIPENIQVTIKQAPDLPPINADAGMMEQMLINLAVNARDAMPDGGELAINVESVLIGETGAKSNPEARPGRFLCFNVADTGCGMTSEILAHLFEPFFTTKPVGKGSGLGLATVYGIVKQHEGWVEVQSEPNCGSCFRVFLPASIEAARDTDAPAAAPEPLPQGSETILVVEDEEVVRDFVVEVLATSGYQVLAAESGPKALECWANHGGRIHLLLTDIVMPGGMNGRELGKRLQTRDGTLKVIYSSGYSPGQGASEAANARVENFLPKPYRAGDLLEKVRRCLNEPCRV